MGLGEGETGKMAGEQNRLRVLFRYCVHLLMLRIDAPGWCCIEGYNGYDSTGSRPRQLRVVSAAVVERSSSSLVVTVQNEDATSVDRRPSQTSGRQKVISSTVNAGLSLSSSASSLFLLSSSSSLPLKHHSNRNILITRTVRDRIRLPRRMWSGSGVRIRIRITSKI